MAQVNSTHNDANRFDRQLNSVPMGGVQLKLFGNPGNVDLKLLYAIFRQADSMQSLTLTLNPNPNPNPCIQ